jgi:hypothetical protein
MIFLIEYDRAAGCLVSLEVFTDDQREKAVAARLERELELHRKTIQHEVVLLEAPSVDALRLTHRRYFESLRELSVSGPKGSST